jgi:hypothetical protein
MNLIYREGAKDAKKTKTVRNQPISILACTLDPANLAQRKNLLLEIIGKATERLAMADGYQFSFDGQAVGLSELVDVIAMERKCCRFLRFTLIAEPDGGPIRLQISGPAGTKEFLESNFSRAAGG